MRVVIASPSLLSGWNHGNAHFLRGIVTWCATVPDAAGEA